MGRGKKLSYDECFFIKNAHAGGDSINKIAKTLNRSRKVISNFIRDDDYGPIW